MRCCLCLPLPSLFSTIFSDLWLCVFLIAYGFPPHCPGFPPLFLFSPVASVVSKPFGLQSVSDLKKPAYLTLRFSFWQFCNTKVSYFHIHIEWSAWQRSDLYFVSLEFFFSPFNGVFLSCRRVQVTIKRDHRAGCEVKGHVITQPPERKTRAAVRHHATLLLLAQMHCND